jgi:hypothetical protein
MQRLQLLADLGPGPPPDFVPDPPVPVSQNPNEVAPTQRFLVVSK